jgi:formylglycine-generating enzyme required for sulfatase activity
MRTCRYCRQAIPAEAAYCPYCARPLTFTLSVHISRQGVVAGVAASLLLIVLWSLLTGSPSVTLVQHVPVTQVVEVTRLVVVTMPTATPGLGSSRWAADGMRQLFVPAGEFLQGSHEGDNDAQFPEFRQHSVYLSAFWIDETEVTNEQYRQCVAAGGCVEPTACGEGIPAYEDATRSDFPVVCVTWDKAEVYCRWAGRRLPTEAEWEKAARGMSGWVYPWGNEPPDCRRANFHGCVFGPIHVGSYRAGASPYGALDMAGNVQEWTADRYDATYYQIAPTNDPPGPRNGSFRVMRGGMWQTGAEQIRAAFRVGFDPEWDVDYVGFRCAESAGEG